MDRYEYIKWYVKDFHVEYAPVLFYEVDKDQERYVTRMAEVYDDYSIKQVIDSGSAFVTEAPVPTVSEINTDSDYFAELISREEFDAVYNSSRYDGSILFPR